MGIIYIACFSIFNYMVLYLNVLPTKYLIPYLTIMIFFVLIFAIIFFVKKIKIGIKIISIFIAIIFCGIFTLGSYYIDKTYDFMGKIGAKKVTLEKYYVVVKNDSNYNQIDDLQNKKIGVYNESLEIYNKALDKLNDSVLAVIKEFESVDSMTKELLNDEVDAILISSAHKSVVDEYSVSFENNTKIIHTIKIEVKNSDEIKHSNINISSDVFTIYISGIDSYGDILTRSRSDVNMLVTVNPKNHEILLTSIPRDYYVQLHNTVGYKDKLTHAGFYGVDCSIKTIEELLKTNIDYYVKVNFSSVEGLVDVIGGVNIYSDTTFVPGAAPNILIKKGYTLMDGRTALAFARERYAYIDGDRHRVKNQQDVLIAIVNKLASSSTLLTKYSEILNQLSTTFETDMQTKDITSLIKHQIDKTPSWTFENYSLDGYDSSNYTYSMGKQKLYVMEPNYNTVETASYYINEMKKGTTFNELGIKN